MLIGMVKKPNKTLVIPRAVEIVEKLISYIAGGNVTFYNHSGKQFGSFLQS